MKPVTIMGRDAEFEARVWPDYEEYAPEPMVAIETEQGTTYWTYEETIELIEALSDSLLEIEGK